MLFPAIEATLPEDELTALAGELERAQAEG